VPRWRFEGYEVSGTHREAARLDSAARELMERHRVNQLPVIVDGRLVGIITLIVIVP
jgi:CBS domain-containing protein